MRLVGVDYLSVDRFHSDTHPAHHALMTAGAAIIEVPYTLRLSE